MDRIMTAIKPIYLYTEKLDFQGCFTGPYRDLDELFGIEDDKEAIDYIDSTLEEGWIGFREVGFAIWMNGTLMASGATEEDAWDAAKEEAKMAALQSGWKEEAKIIALK